MLFTYYLKRLKPYLYPSTPSSVAYSFASKNSEEIHEENEEGVLEYEDEAEEDEHEYDISDDEVRIVNGYEAMSFYSFL